MNSTIIYYKAIPIIISILGIVLTLKKLKNTLKNTYKRHFIFSVFLFFTMYFMIVFSSTMQGIYYQSILDNYDVNHNGIIESSEQVFDFEKAMKNVISDTGRNLAFITGAVFSFLVSAIILLINIIIKKIKIS